MAEGQGAQAPGWFSDLVPAEPGRQRGGLHQGAAPERRGWRWGGTLGGEPGKSGLKLTSERALIV